MNSLTMALQGQLGVNNNSLGLQGQLGINNNDPGVKYAPQQPVVQQPAPMMHTNNNTVVINNQQQQQGITYLRRWNTGMCECFKDINSCCLVCLFGDLYGMCWVPRVNESFCLPVCCPLSWLGAVRTKIRTAYDIEGGVLEDLLWASPACCCRSCIYCQMIREVDIMTNRGQPLI